MFSIRRGAFETNSSSVHALIIADAMPDLSKPLTVHVRPGEYGWGVETLDDPDERASYLYTAMCCVNRNDPVDELSEMLAPWGVTVICDVPPRFVTYGDNDDVHTYLDNGYINHDYEIKGFVEAVLENPVLALRFIFSDDSRAIIYNDNMYEYEFDEIKSLYPTTPYTLYEKGN